MNAFCPFINDKCRGNKCVMWEDNGCVIVNFMKSFTELSEGDVILPVVEEDNRTPDLYSELKREANIPEEIKTASPEELAAELVSFIKTEFPEAKRTRVRDISIIFWEIKNVERWGIPPDIRLKLEKAEMLAKRQLEEEKELKEKEQLEREKAKLPSLVNSCIEWAEEHDLKRVTKTDVEAFLIEKNVDILPQTQRALYAMVNVKLKSKQ